MHQTCDLMSVKSKVWKKFLIRTIIINWFLHGYYYVFFLHYVVEEGKPIPVTDDILYAFRTAEGLRPFLVSTMGSTQFMINQSFPRLYVCR